MDARAAANIDVARRLRVGDAATSRANRDRDADDERRDELERELLQHELRRPRLLGEPEQPERDLADDPAEDAELESLRDARANERHPEIHPEEPADPGKVRQW